MKHTPTTTVRSAESVRPPSAQAPLLPAKVSHGAITLERSLEGWSVTLHSGSRQRLDLFINGSVFLMTAPLSMLMGAILIHHFWQMLNGRISLEIGSYVTVIATGAFFSLIPYTTGRLLLRTLSTTRLEVVGDELRVRRWWAGREHPPLRVPLSDISAPTFTGNFHSQTLHLSESIAVPSYVAKKNRALVLHLLGEGIAFAQKHPRQVPPIPEDLQALLTREDG